MPVIALRRSRHRGRQRPGAYLIRYLAPLRVANLREASR
ncbi:hypothetical protein OKW43_002873 [Paraburkholderia sp. WC7.3g]